MVGLEQVKQALQMVEDFIARYGGPLPNKKAIMRYTRFGESLLDECIRGGFPCFKLGGTIISHTAAVDEWLIGMSKRRVNMQKEGDQKEYE